MEAPGRVSAGLAGAACVIAAALQSLPASAHVSVALRRRVEATGRLVTVGEVARVEDTSGVAPALAERVSGVALGLAPAPGETRMIPRRFVGARLRQEGVSPEDFVLCGERSTAVLGPASGAAALLGHAAADAVESFVARELGCAVESVEVDVLELRWITRRAPLAAGEYAFAVSARAGGGSLGRARYVLKSIAAPGAGSVGRVAAWTDTARYVPAAVPRRPVAAGDELDSGDLARAVAPVREDGASVVADPEAAASRVAARAIEAGEPVGEESLLPHPLVREGGEVTVVVEQPGLGITSSALALRSGAKGELVPVRNAGSGREFLARVEGENVVVVP